MLDRQLFFITKMNIKTNICGNPSCTKTFLSLNSTIKARNKSSKEMDMKKKGYNLHGVNLQIS